MSNAIDVKFCVEPGDRSVGIYEYWYVQIEAEGVVIEADMKYGEPVAEWEIESIEVNGQDAWVDDNKLGDFPALAQRVEQMHEIHLQQNKCEALGEYGWGYGSWINDLEFEQSEGWEQKIKELRQENGRAAGQYASAQRKLKRLLDAADLDDATDLVEVI